VAAVRPRPDGGASVLIDRDEGCGPLLSEVPLGPDGTAGAPVLLTAAPLAPKLGVDFLGLGGDTPALVTRTAAGAVAVARTAPEAPFAAPIALALPARARRGPTAVLPDGRVVVAFSRACRPGARVSEAVVVAPGAAAKPVRLSRCGDPSPVHVDRTGRAVFVAHRNGDLVGWATAPLGYPSRAKQPVRVNRCGDPEPVLVDSSGRVVFVTDADGLKAWSSAPVERYAHPRRTGVSTLRTLD
jgi:hypothetical protein